MTALVGRSFAIFCPRLRAFTAWFEHENEILRCRLVFDFSPCRFFQVRQAFRSMCLVIPVFYARILPGDNYCLESDFRFEEFLEPFRLADIDQVAVGLDVIQRGQVSSCPCRGQLFFTAL